MSLDVYLEVDEMVPFSPGSGIFVREDGETREISEEEWLSRYPDREPVRVKHDIVETNRVYHRNITHNLGRMAREAGIYEHLWRPDEINITKASQLIDPLRDGLARLMQDPERFKSMNPSNGWGSYEGLVQFVGSYLQACMDYPEATVTVSR